MNLKSNLKNGNDGDSGSGESDLEDSPEALLDPVGDCVSSYERPSHPSIRTRADASVSRSRSASPCLSTSSSSLTSSPELRRQTPGVADVSLHFSPFFGIIRHNSPSLRIFWDNLGYLLDNSGSLWDNL